MHPSTPRNSGEIVGVDFEDPDTVINIGKYRIIKTIGKGNFAKVKLALHTLTNKEVAIKVVDKSKLNASGLIKLFREVRILKMLDHPNIVKLLEVIETENTLYLIMEYCSGGEVFDFLVSHGKMKEKEARNKFRQILSAVEYCHQRHVIHRDLKAENLLLDANLNIKIADFGFSNEYHPGGKLETFCGSPPYAAPELFQGRKYEGPEVDIWSLGVILYTLVSGMLPFDGQNLRELREHVLKGKFRIPFYMTTDCESLIKRMLVLNPLKRATMKTIMEDKWTNISFESDRLRPYVPQAHNDVDFERIEILCNMGFAYDEVMTSLSNNAYDDVMATYLLLDKTKFGPCDSLNISNVGDHSSPAFTPTQTKQVAPTRVNTVVVNPPYVPPRMYETAKTIECNDVKSSGIGIKKVGDGDRSAKLALTPPQNVQRNRSKTQVDTTTRENKRETPSSFLNRFSIKINRKSTQTSQEEESGRGVDQKSPSSGNSTTQTTGSPKPRSLRFTWSMKTTSNKEPEEMMREIIRVLKSNGVAYEHKDHFLLLCMFETHARVANAAKTYISMEPPVQFEVEICKLPRINLNGVRFKRIAGTSIAFKNVASKIADELKL